MQYQALNTHWSQVGHQMRNINERRQTMSRLSRVEKILIGLWAISVVITLVIEFMK